MKTPKEKYMNDPEYHHFVQMIEQMIEQARFTPSELREMCMLACINYEMRHVREHTIDPRVDEAFRVLDDFVSTPRRR
jgi:restriction endonuclease Mrr